MELSKALKSLFDVKGLDIIKSPIAINILDDYLGFDDFQSARYILKVLIDGDYINKIISSVNKNSIDDINTIYNILYSKYGFRNNIITYTINSLLEALDSDLSLEDDIKTDDNKIIDEDQVHIQFLGIPISGSLQAFINNLIKKTIFNFIGLFEDNNGALFEGEYGGLENARIEINASPYTKQVYFIAILSTEIDEWFMLSTQYEIIKSKLESKFGLPNYSEDLESFYNTKRILYPELDDIEYLKYRGFGLSSRWDFDNGTVSLRICDNCRVQLTYTDKINEANHIEARDNII